MGDPARVSFDESRLRHPTERPIFILSVLLNVAIVGAAVALVVSEWLELHPRLAKYANELVPTATAVILAPFILTFTRNQRHAVVRANSVQLSRTQIPEIYDEFARMCATLGVSPPPELYVSEDAIDAPSGAYSSWHVDYVVLDVKFLESKLNEVRGVYRFFLGRELGRIRLGHTRWIDEILLAYVVRIPVLRNPLMHARTYSHDRYAASLAPDSIRGLVVEASGRHMLKRMDVDAFLRQALAVHGLWARAASMAGGLPRVAYRVQELDRAGLLAATPMANDARP
jgi:hypothetical protein